jgi:acetyl esterase
MRLGGGENEAELAIYLGGAHGFTLFPNELSKSAQARMDTFLIITRFFG